MATSETNFFYGSARLDETTGVGFTQFGLFNAVENRFVVTHPELEILQLTAMLFSSRYDLIPCDLVRATNFQPRLIDNSCCTNWTIGNQQILSFTRYNRFVDALVVTELCPAIQPAPQTLLNNDIQYIWAVRQLIEDFVIARKYVSRCNTVVLTMLDTPFAIPELDFFRKSFNIIYRQPDFKKAWTDIQELKKNYICEWGDMPLLGKELVL